MRRRVGIDCELKHEQRDRDREDSVTQRFEATERQLVRRAGHSTEPRGEG